MTLQITCEEPAGRLLRLKQSMKQLMRIFYVTVDYVYTWFLIAGQPNKDV